MEKSIRLTFEGKEYNARENETVLDALLRQGCTPSFSCRNGICLVCMQRGVGEIPEKSQRVLKPSLQKAGYFLPCKCVPTGDLEILPPRPEDLYCPTVLAEKEQLSEHVWRLLLEPSVSIYYHAGQFINLRRSSDGVTRSYSLASVPNQDYFLEIHVKRVPGGELSNWLIDEFQVGEEISLQGPNGRSFYPAGHQEVPMLLIGTGTGLAPLIGVVRDALTSGHTAPIVLFHGSHDVNGLYLHNTLLELAARYPQLEYVPCVSGEPAPEGITQGRADDVAFARFSRLDGWQFFAAGQPEMCENAGKSAGMRGIVEAAIHLDPFIQRSDEAPKEQVARSSDGSRPRAPADLEMWAAMGEDGELLRTILTDFYNQVFVDEILSPYFHNITKERVIGNVFSFMRDWLKGEHVYFGMQPRTAHHWMVISDEIFDYRENLMMATVRKYGVDEKYVQRWRAFEESFRGDTVKDTPWKLIMNGVEMPLDGYNEEVLTVGTLCDGCQGAIEPGETAQYHVRLGLTFCGNCYR